MKSKTEGPLPEKFSSYQALHIATLFERKYKGGTVVSDSPWYYEVLSSVLGRCGHRHRTFKAAEPCLERMKAMMKSRRKP